MTRTHSRRAGRSLCAALCLAAMLVVAGEVRAGSDEGILGVWVGGGYTNHSIERSSLSAHGGGIRGQVNAMLPLLEMLWLDWDIVDIEGMWTQEGSGFELDMAAQLRLHLRFFHMGIGLGLGVSRYDAWSKDPSHFNAATAFGFHIPMEIGFHFGPVELFGGMEVRWVAKSEREMLGHKIGEELKAYGGITLLMGKVTGLKIEYDYRILDDWLRGHTVVLSVDLAGLFKRLKRKGIGRKSYGGGDDESSQEEESSYEDSYSSDEEPGYDGSDYEDDEPVEDDYYQPPVPEEDLDPPPVESVPTAPTGPVGLQEVDPGGSAQQELELDMFGKVDLSIQCDEDDKFCDFLIDDHSFAMLVALPVVCESYEESLAMQDEVLEMVKQKPGLEFKEQYYWSFDLMPATAFVYDHDETERTVGFVSFYDSDAGGVWTFTFDYPSTCWQCLSAAEDLMGKVIKTYD